MASPGCRSSIPRPSWELGEAPDHLLVLGGGFIGLEFGQMFRRFGSDVTILEAGPRIASREDEDVSAALTDILRDDGIDVRTSVRVQEVEPRPDGGVVLTVEDGSGEERVSGTHLLVAMGRAPNSDALDPDVTGCR